MLIYKGDRDKIMKYSCVAEHNLLDFIITCIGETNFQEVPTILVKKPFGCKKTREKNIKEEGDVGTSNIKPDFCFIHNDHGYVGEVAGAKDTKPSCKEYSESHYRIWELVEQSNSDQNGKNTKIYFAQKIMCQIYPVYRYLKNERNIDVIQCYYGATEIHKDIVENIFELLCINNFLSSMPNRPLKYMDFDINKYGIAIYEIKFHDGLLDETEMRNKLDIDLNTKQTVASDGV